MKFLSSENFHIILIILHVAAAAQGICSRELRLIQGVKRQTITREMVLLGFFTAKVFLGH